MAVCSQKSAIDYVIPFKNQTFRYNAKSSTFMLIGRERQRVPTQFRRIFIFIQYMRLKFGFKLI